MIRHILLAFVGRWRLHALSLLLRDDAPAGTGRAARPIVMVIGKDGDLCIGTALARDLVQTAAQCAAHEGRYQIKACQTGAAMSVQAKCE